MGRTDLDAALDELYGASPAEFTARRDALAKRLKETGGATAASELKARRKPTQLAYVLNQLARRHADDVAELVDVGRELARAQRKALRGEEGRDLRDAIGRQRIVVAGLTSKAAKLMGELGVPVSGHLDEIASALRTAMVDPAVGAQLEEGRLDKVPEAAAGFPGATTLQLVRTPPEDADADEKAKAKAKAGADEKAKAHAHPKPAESTRADAKARALEERNERERAKRRAEATAAGADAAKRARIADEAERDADGHAAEAKKLDDEASALAVEAKSLDVEAKRVAAEAKARAAEAKAKAHEADAVRRKAERAATEAARANQHAKVARSDAERAVKHARSVEARAQK